ncbi:MAG: hypothetical protein IJS90_05525 [Clostridia bacterium]|nr:hypothetical protein [Clostridia bacterium]
MQDESFKKKNQSYRCAYCRFALFSVSCLALPAFAADVKETVCYVDENGIEQTVEATVLESGSFGAAGETNWYVLKGEAECTAVIPLRSLCADLHDLQPRFYLRKVFCGACVYKTGSYR